MELVIHPRATADLDECAAFIAARDEDAARRWLLAARATFHRLLERPRIGRRWTMTARTRGELRWVQIAGFRNYLVFYQVSVNRVTVVRVLHGAMDLPTAVADL